MAKKKKNENDDDFIDEDDGEFDGVFDSFFANIDKDIESIPDSKIIIPTGIDILDTVLGGGVRCNVTQWIGNAGSGKSAMCASILKSTQKKYKDPIIIYADSENSTDFERLTQLRVDANNVKILSGITVEDIFKTIDKICEYKEKNKHLNDIPSIVVWDSYALTMSEAEMASSELVQTAGAQKVKLVSYYLPKYINKLKKYNIALLIVNQFIDAIDMNASKYSHPIADLKFARKGKVLPGGNRLRYASYQIVELRQNEKLDEVFGFNGIRCSAFTVKNKSFDPNVPINMVFSYSAGFSNFWTNFEMLKEYGYIKSGAWCSLKDCPQPSFRQIEAIKIYRNNDEWKSAFDKSVKDCLQINFVEKYKITEDRLNQIDID